MKVCPFDCSLSDFPAASIVEKHPNYRLFTNNCQNFGQYLVKAICGQDVLCPATIQNILERLFLAREAPACSPEILPGTYPPSLLAPIYPTLPELGGHLAVFSPQSYYTATPHSYYTATPHSYYTPTSCSYVSPSCLKGSDHAADIDEVQSRHDETSLDIFPIDQLPLPPQLSACIFYLDHFRNIQSPPFVQYDKRFIYLVKSVTRILGPLALFEMGFRKAFVQPSFEHIGFFYLKLEAHHICSWPVRKSWEDVSALFVGWPNVAP